MLHQPWSILLHRAQDPTPGATRSSTGSGLGFTLLRRTNYRLCRPQNISEGQRTLVCRHGNTPSYTRTDMYPFRTRHIGAEMSPSYGSQPRGTGALEGYSSWSMRLCEFPMTNGHICNNGWFTPPPLMVFFQSGLFLESPMWKMRPLWRVHLLIGKLMSMVSS